MSQFLEAQKRFNENRLFGSGGYVNDLLKSYGDGGRRINLPQVTTDTFDEVMRYRQQEKQHYASLASTLSATQKELEQTRSEMNRINQRNVRLTKTMDEFLMSLHSEEQPDAPPGDRDSGVDPGSDSGAGVLHAEDRPDQSDTDIGKPKTIISGSKHKDERPSDRSGRSRPDGNDERKPRETRFKDTEEPDTGRAQPDATDAPEPDVGRSAGEHSVEE